MIDVSTHIIKDIIRDIGLIRFIYETIKMIPSIIKSSYKNYKQYEEMLKAMDYLQRAGIIEFKRGEK